MKKILFSILSLGVVAVVSIGATRAYFSDTQQILGNDITTGFLEVSLDDLGGNVYLNSMNFPLKLAPGISTRWISPNDVEGKGTIPGLEILVAEGSMQPDHYEAKFTFNNFADGQNLGYGSYSTKDQYTKAVEVVQLHSQAVPGWNYTELLSRIDDSKDGVTGFRSLYDLERSIIDNIPVGSKKTTLRFEFKMRDDAGNSFQGDTIKLDLYIGAAQVAGQSVLSVQ